jgi:hypothetical protein
MACIVTERLPSTRGEQPVFTRNPIAYLLNMITPYDEWEKAGRERTNWQIKRGRGKLALRDRGRP